MKKTKKQLQAEAFAHHQKQLRDILNVFSMQEMAQYIFDRIWFDIEYLDKSIKDELEYIKNETDSYASQKADSRRYVKMLTKQKKTYLKLLKQLQRTFAQIQKVEE